MFAISGKLRAKRLFAFSPFKILGSELSKYLFYYWIDSYDGYSVKKGNLIYETTTEQALTTFAAYFI